MNYKNANHILPDRLVREIQQYVQGEYIYIPIKDKVINPTPTEYEQELNKRNETYKDVKMIQRNIKILTILEDMGILVGGIVFTKDKKTYSIFDKL